MIGEKIDRLFLEKDCPFCGVIRAELNMKAVTSDDFRGTTGQKFHVFSSLSNEASIEMLEKFGFAGKFIPVLETHEGEALTEVDQILAYLRTNGMSAEVS